MWTLANPENLYLGVIPLLMTLYFLIRKQKKSNALKLTSLPIIKTQSRRLRFAFRVLYALLILSLVLLVVVVARPIKEHSSIYKWSEGIDLVIVLDVSESMDATDFAPNRMVVAKEMVKRFIKSRFSDRIGLVIFAGEAVSKSPLTTDYDFLISQVESIQLRELKQGTAIGMALTNGISKLRSSKSKTKVIILLTDGDSNVGSINPLTASQLAKEEGVKIYSIGIGKEDRVVVPIYAYDSDGKKTHLITQVPSYLNPDLLKKISNETGGLAFMARDTDALRETLSQIGRLERTKIKQLPRTETEELFLPFALIGVFSSLIVFILQETRLFIRVR